MRLPKKELSHQEAVKRIEMTRVQIGNLEEEIFYWRLRLSKPLEQVDNFIIFADKTINSPQEIIDRNLKQREQKYFLIENYYNKFVVRTNEGNDQSPIVAPSSEVADEIPITLVGRAESRLSQLKLDM